MKLKIKNGKAVVAKRLAPGDYMKLTFAPVEWGQDAQIVQEFADRILKQKADSAKLNRNALELMYKLPEGVKAHEHIKKFAPELKKRISRKYRLDHWKVSGAVKGAKAPTPKKLDRATKSKSVGLFKKKGLDGNGRFPSVSRALVAAWDALNKLGIGPGQVVTADLFKGDKGNRLIDLEWTNTSDDAFMPGAAIPNSGLAISWTKMDNGKYEVLCYLS